MQRCALLWQRPSELLNGARGTLQELLLRHLWVEGELASLLLCPVPLTLVQPAIGARRDMGR